MIWAERCGHYAVGAAIGIVMAAILAFSSGWIMFARSVEARIERAQIEAFASVCVHNSLAAWVDAGNRIEMLAGDSNRDREELVERYIPIMDSTDGLEHAVGSVCGNIIRARA